MERRFKITVNGREYDVTVEDLSQGPSTILPGPGDMKVPAPGALPPAPSAPGAPPAPSAPPASAPRGDAPLDPTALPSPLAGVIASIEVQAGDRVESGQKVAEIEAMKMKTVIAADHDGKVTKIMVKAGDAVDSGQALMTIE